MGTTVDIKGKKFGKLLVLNSVGVNKQRAIIWTCLCDCGNTTQVSGVDLRNGHTASCGCLYRKHGHNGTVVTRTYRIWTGMKTRCFNARDKSYKLYGAKGITMCIRWLEFSNFLADMGECPPNKSIDRINGAGNYERANCRWATITEQNNNKRNNILLTYEGNTMSIKDWSKRTGLAVATISHRIKRYGWSDAEALTIKPHQRNVVERMACNADAAYRKANPNCGE